MTTLIVRRVDRKAIPLERRSTFAALADLLSDRLYAAAARHGEDVVVLSTCERFEVYHASSSTVTSQVWDRSEIARLNAATATDVDALRHLFRVAAGLESRIPGEPHVVGQLRDALGNARRNNTARDTMADAFSSAIECGRRVRRQTALGSSASDYAGKTIERLTRELNGLEGRDVAVVGTGALATEIARGLRGASARLTIVGRHEARVSAVANDIGADWLPLRALDTTPTRFAAIVTAVATAEPVITVDTLGTCDTRLLIDLGAAPNVDHRVDRIPGVLVVRLDDLGGCWTAASTFAHADAIVEREVARYLATSASNPREWRGAARRLAS